MQMTLINTQSILMKFLLNSKAEFDLSLMPGDRINTLLHGTMAGCKCRHLN